ncbi:MAG: DUF1963 domain-containing protein [Planctomycetes bacterium]|nr:DUF1963 domain-containing protein [Planctomycetota bacterium]
MDSINSIRKPTIVLSKTYRKTFSRLAGLPMLPDNIEWPKWNNKPMEFLCQLDLSEIPNDCERNALPKNGLLHVFYNEDQAWGIDSKDKDGWKVIYSERLNEECKLRNEPDGLIKEKEYKEKSVFFRPMLTFPDWTDERILSLGFNEQQNEDYSNLTYNLFQEQPKHQLFGYPEVLQNNTLELECDIFTNGLTWDDYYKLTELKQKQMEDKSRSEWVLLLQLDSDDDVGFMWGDCGLLYFWIKKDDLKSGNFDNIWLILICG